MSVQKTSRNGLTRYVVKWREAGQSRSRTFDRRGDADDYDRQLRLLRQQGELAGELQKRRLILNDIIVMWWERRAEALAQSTIEQYSIQLDHRIVPQLGRRHITQLTPAVIEEWISWMRRRGDRDPTITKACTTLQSVLAVAVADGVLSSNPVAMARKPPQRRGRTPLLIRPVEVEVMRRWMLDKGRERDVMLLELLAYAGLRPESEALKLPWRHVRDRSLLVQDTKRARERTIVLVEPLQASLQAWRMRSGRPTADALVIPARHIDAWSRDDWRSWRRHRFAPAAAAAGLPADARPRDLRSSFVSLLVHEGRNIVEVARQVGHSAEICLRDYLSVFDDHDPADRKPAAQIITEARAAAAGTVESRQTEVL